MGLPVYPEVAQLTPKLRVCKIDDYMKSQAVGIQSITAICIYNASQKKGNQISGQKFSVIIIIPLMRYTFMKSSTFI